MSTNIFTHNVIIMTCHDMPYTFLCLQTTVSVTVLVFMRIKSKAN